MTNQQINTLILRNLEHREFLFYTLRSLKSTIEMFGSTGATMTNLSKGKFENIHILKPPDHLISQYSDIAKPLFDMIKNLSEQSIMLKQTRDLLLPRLISGKLRVKDVMDVAQGNIQ